MSKHSEAEKERGSCLVRSFAISLEVLRLEVRDERTWETRYHMIMALGACGFGSASEVLCELGSLENENNVPKEALKVVVNPMPDPAIGRRN